MDYLISIFAVPLVAALVVVGGMALENRGAKRGIYDTQEGVKDYVIWGGGFFVAFSAEFMALSTI